MIEPHLANCDHVQASLSVAAASDGSPDSAEDRCDVAAHSLLTSGPPQDCHEDAAPTATAPASATPVPPDGAGRRLGGDQRGRRAVWLALWTASYAAYRFYYAFGGQIGMVGRPTPAAHFHEDNLVGAIIILTAGLLPLAACWGWRHRAIRELVRTVGWVATVGSCMHALTLEILRILSLSGVHATHYPPGLWVSIDRHQADLQDALFNEPWFFITGLLCARFALTATKPTSRPVWRRSATVATLLSLAVGVLSGLGAIPTLRVG